MAILAGLVGIIGLLVGLADDDAVGFMVFTAGLAGVLTCMVGRVLIYIAATLEDIAFVLGAPGNAKLWPLRDQIADPTNPPA